MVGGGVEVSELTGLKIVIFNIYGLEVSSFFFTEP